MAARRGTLCWAPSTCHVTYTQHLITSFTVALFGLFYYFYLADEETALGMVQPPAVSLSKSSLDNIPLLPLLLVPLFLDKLCWDPNSLSLLLGCAIWEL